MNYYYFHDIILVKSKGISSQKKIAIIFINRTRKIAKVFELAIWAVCKALFVYLDGSLQCWVTIPHILIGLTLLSVYFVKLLHYKMLVFRKVVRANNNGFMSAQVTQVVE